MDDLKRNYMLQRSSLEHHLLPDLVFDDTKRIIGALATKREEVLFHLYDQVMPGRFKKEQFKVTPGPNKMGGISIIMRLPDPDVPLMTHLDFHYMHPDIHPRGDQSFHRLVSCQEENRIYILSYPFSGFKKKFGIPILILFQKRRAGCLPTLFAVLR